MLNEQRLKDKLIAAFNEQDEQEDADAAISRIMGKVAAAIVSEIKELKIQYTTGLTAGSTPVTGQLQHTVQ